MRSKLISFITFLVIVPSLVILISSQAKAFDGEETDGDDVEVAHSIDKRGPTNVSTSTDASEASEDSTEKVEPSVKFFGANKY